MTLDRLIGRIALIGGLSLFGYNCDSSSDPASCIKDTDCKENRICESGKCVEGKTSSKVSNPCGNSPVYGKHLWEISDCDGGIHFREDCTVGRGWGTGNYDYAPQKWGGVSKYNNMEINMPNFPGKPYVLETSPIFQPKFSSEVQKIEKVKKKMAELGGGYFLHFKNEPIKQIDDNAFVVVDKPYPGEAACENSIYFVP